MVVNSHRGAKQSGGGDKGCEAAYKMTAEPRCDRDIGGEKHFSRNTSPVFTEEQSGKFLTV